MIVESAPDGTAPRSRRSRIRGSWGLDQTIESPRDARWHGGRRGGSDSRRVWRQQGDRYAAGRGPPPRPPGTPPARQQRRVRRSRPARRRARPRSSTTAVSSAVTPAGTAAAAPTTAGTAAGAAVLFAAGHEVAELRRHADPAHRRRRAIRRRSIRRSASTRPTSPSFTSSTIRYSRSMTRAT